MSTRRTIPLPLLLVVVAVIVAAHFAASAIAQTNTLTGKPWLDMEYGPIISATIGAPQPANNVTPKGVAVRLGRSSNSDGEGAGGDDSANGQTAGVVFDTDLLRYAFAWSGGEGLKLEGVAFDGQHGPHPRVEENIIFANRAAPGWAKGGRFDDPRRFPAGPLPRDWAYYRGLYKHGKRVVFRYTVGGVEILDSPGLERKGSTIAVTRTIHIAKSETDLLLHVCEADGAAVATLSRDDVKPAKANDPADQTVCVLSPLDADPQKPQPVTMVAAAVDIGGVTWRVRDGSRLLLSVPAFATPATIKLLHVRAPMTQLDAFARLAKTTDAPADLSQLTLGGPTQWKESVTTRGDRANADDENGKAFVVDTIGVPLRNPWRSWMRLTGLDFFADGRAAVCTLSGDVWLVAGLDDTLQGVTWKRFAAGLHQPLGLRIVDGKVCVLGRDQITRLHDFNGDDEADFYECVNNDMLVTEHYHEFAADLQTDAAGNFYIAKSARFGMRATTPHHGAVLRVSADGKTLDVLARGWRSPNGLAVRAVKEGARSNPPQGGGAGNRRSLKEVLRESDAASVSSSNLGIDIIVTDNDGHWTPKSRIDLLRPDAFHGYMWTYHDGPVPTDYRRPICWLPHDVCVSPASPLWATGGKLGPLDEQLLLVSYQPPGLLLVLPQRLGGFHNRVQGGVVRLPIEFNTGMMRGRVNPRDGHLYLAGMKGWKTDGKLTSGLQRVRHTGRAANLPVALRITASGVELTFSDPLERASVVAGAFDVKRWNYEWSRKVGSKDVSFADPAAVGRDAVKVTGVSLSDDGRTVTLSLADMQPSMQLQIAYDVKSAAGESVRDAVFATVNATPE